MSLTQDLCMFISLHGTLHRSIYLSLDKWGQHEIYRLMKIPMRPFWALCEICVIICPMWAFPCPHIADRTHTSQMWGSPYIKKPHDTYMILHKAHGNQMRPTSGSQHVCELSTMHIILYIFGGPHIYPTVISQSPYKPPTPPNGPSYANIYLRNAT